MLGTIEIKEYKILVKLNNYKQFERISKNRLLGIIKINKNSN